jgi:hypothetical protein
MSRENPKSRKGTKMRSFSIFLIGLLVGAAGVGMGVAVLWATQSREQAVAADEAGRASSPTEIVALRKELGAARETIAALEASVAAAKLATATRRFTDAGSEAPGAQIDPNDADRPPQDARPAEAPKKESK